MRELNRETLKDATPQELAELERELERELALQSPADFAEYVTGKTSPQLPFLRPPHVEYLNEIITRFVEGRLLKPDGTPYKKLLINVPPRHGKTELTGKYTPAWYLAKFPDKKVINVAYGSDLAAKSGGRARDILTELGPDFGIQVNPQSRSQTDWSLLKRAGSMRSAGVTGGVTGLGADLMIIDDPISNAEDAASEVMRNKVWDLYASTLLSRLEGDKLMIVIQTRWHFDDLTGRLKQLEPDEWFHINLPAIATEADILGRVPGEALWPERYSLEEFARIRHTDPRVWASLYQQVPQLGDTAHFNPENYRYFVPASNGDVQSYRLFQPGPKGTTVYTDVPVDKCWRFQTADLAISEKTRADWTVLSTWAVTPAKDLLLLDVYRERIDGTKHQRMFDIQIKKWQPRFTGIESQTFGATLIKSMLRLGYKIRELKADKDKESRAWVAGSLVNAGRVYFPQGREFLAEWEEELNQFPYGKHDDQVDTFSYAAKTIVDKDKRARKQANREPETYDEKVWANILGKKKKRYLHPELGNW